MSSRRMHARRISVIAGALGALGMLQQADAGLLFRSQSSTLSITHDRDITQADPLAVKTITTVPASSAVYPNAAYQLNRILTSADGTASSQAAGSLGHVTNATTGSFVLATGTGVTQSDPGNLNFPGQSSLKFDVDLRWSVTSGGFGPVATGFASITAGGVVGVGGRADLKINLQFLDGNGVALRNPWVIDAWWTTPGAFTTTFPTAAVLGAGTLAEGSTLRIRGTIEFLASNDGSPTSILPLNVESGFTPPTGTFSGDGQELIWGSPTNWASADPYEDGLLSIPNGIGQRARFLDSLNPRGILFTQAITLGTLDIDSSQNHSFTPSTLIPANGGPGLTFQTYSGPAVLNVSNNFSGNREMQVGVPIDPQEAPVTNFTVPIHLLSHLDIEQNSRNGLLWLQNPIDGPGGITKNGPGAIILDNANNLFTGGMFIREGVVYAMRTGTLGAGNVNVIGGVLEYNAARAAQNGVVVQSGGLVNLGIVPGVNESFEIDEFGGIQGNASELNALSVGGNLILHDRAMIVHEAGSVGNPQGLGNEPKYIYGLHGQFPNLNLTLGDESTTPWVGLGAGRGVNSIGTATSGAVNFLGGGYLVALGDSVLKINAPISGDGGTEGTSVEKVGTGTVAIQNPNNTFYFYVNHREGTLLVNGTLDAEVFVDPGAVLGGVGNLPSYVFVSNDARLAPGSSVGTLANPNPVPVGTLNVGSLSLVSQSQLDFEIGASAHDQVEVLYGLTLDGVLNILALDDFAPGVYTILRYGSSIYDQGLEIGNAPPGFVYSIDVIDFAAIGAPQEGGVVNLVVSMPFIPEPGTLSLLGMGALALLRRRRA